VLAAALFFAAFESNALTGQSLVVSFMQWRFAWRLMGLIFYSDRSNMDEKREIPFGRSANSGALVRPPK
jgi:hypothetical protein